MKFTLLNAIKTQALKTMTLLERMLYGLKHFVETGRHLDGINITLCSGSRFGDGRVPGVYWDPVSRGVGVGFSRPDGAGEFLRARAVVAL